MKNWKLFLVRYSSQLERLRMNCMNKTKLINSSSDEVMSQPINQFQIGIVLIISITHMFLDIMTNVIPMLLTLMQQAYHLSYTQLGVVVMVNMICTSLIQPVFGYISDRKSLVWLMTAG